jgi:hypothetical protein
VGKFNGVLCTCQARQERSPRILGNRRDPSNVNCARPTAAAKTSKSSCCQVPLLRETLARRGTSCMGAKPLDAADRVGLATHVRRERFTGFIVSCVSVQDTESADCFPNYNHGRVTQRMMCVSGDPSDAALLAEWNTARGNLGASTSTLGLPGFQDIPPADPAYIQQLRQQQWSVYCTRRRISLAALSWLP